MEKVLEGLTKDGKEVYRYTLTDASGFHVCVSNLGANVRRIYAVDKNGDYADVVLGYDDYEAYFDNVPFYGCAVVPHANRIGGATFTLNGTTYTLDQNDGENNLHSGFSPLAHEIYDVLSVDEHHITFSYAKKDMQNGFPGNVTITITYTVTEDHALRIDYQAISDADTLFNPTNHSYFNLAGEGSGSVLSQRVWIDADQITPPDEKMIPHGDLYDVAGTAFDFTKEHALGDHFNDDDPILRGASGYDHNYVLKTTPGDVSVVATMYDEKSGRLMEVLTDRPGMQLYTANFLDASETGKGGHHYHPQDAVCFETQLPANAINVPSFPQPILRAGETAKTTTIYRFSVE